MKSAIIDKNQTGILKLSFAFFDIIYDIIHHNKIALIDVKLFSIALLFSGNDGYGKRNAVVIFTSKRIDNIGVVFFVRFII